MAIYIEVILTEEGEKETRRKRRDLSLPLANVNPAANINLHGEHAPVLHMPGYPDVVLSFATKHFARDWLESALNQIDV